MSLKAAILNRSKGWRFSGTPNQGEAMPHWPCNYWVVCNRPAGKIALRDPQYGHLRDFWVYEGETDGAVYRFAYQEVSNGVFAVFERN